MSRHWLLWLVVGVGAALVGCQATAAAPPKPAAQPAGLSITAPPDASVGKVSIYLQNVDGYGRALWVDVDVTNSAQAKKVFVVSVTPNDLPDTAEESRAVDPGKAGTVKIMTLLKGQMPSTLKIGVTAKDAK